MQMSFNEFNLTLYKAQGDLVILTGSIELTIIVISNRPKRESYEDNNCNET